MFTNFSPLPSIAKAVPAPEQGAQDAGQGVIATSDAGFAAVLSDLLVPDEIVVGLPTTAAAPLLPAAEGESGKFLPVSGKAGAGTGKNAAEAMSNGEIVEADPAAIATIPGQPGSPIELPLVALPHSVPPTGDGSPPATHTAALAERAVTASSDPLALSSAQSNRESEKSANPIQPRSDAPIPSEAVAKEPVRVVLREAVEAVKQPATLSALAQTRAATRPDAAPAVAGPASSQQSSAEIQPAFDSADPGAERGGSAESSGQERPLSATREVQVERAGGFASLSAPAVTIAPINFDRPAAPPAAPTAIAPPQPGAIDAVAHVIDRLMESRMLGHIASASVSIRHAEFGELDITFTQPGATLDVAVTAADSASQRALAAAMQSGERTPGRDGGQPQANSSAPGAQQRSADGGGTHRESGGHPDARDAEHRRASSRPDRSDDRPPAPNTTSARHGGTNRRSGIYA